jgi:hypothetical protein
MKIRFNLLAQGGVLLALAALLSACASSASRLENSSGGAVRAAFAAQVLDPAAVRNANPVTGLDGHAARAANEQYERSFSAPAAAPAPMLIINGGGK